MRVKFASMLRRVVIGFCLVVLAAADTAKAESYDLIIMAGQSNMYGYQGDAAGYPEDPQKLDLRIPFWWVAPRISSSEQHWTTMKAQGGRFPAGQFGPEVTFARTLLESGMNPAIFKYSQGSTSLYAHWKQAGEHGLYDQMLAGLRIALAAMEKDGHKVRVRGFVWIQGESDAAASDEAANAYHDHLEKLITHLRHELNEPLLPVVLGLDEQHPGVIKRPVVIKAQELLAVELPCVVRSSMLGLVKADSSHLTPTGLVEHGKRLAADYLTLLKKTAPVPEKQ
jgi:hypothetical protein